MQQFRWSNHPSAHIVMALLLGASTACARGDSPADGSAMRPAAGTVASAAPLAARRESVAADTASGGPTVATSVPGSPAPDVAAMVIHTATAAVEVEKLDPAVDAARRSAARLGGVIADASIETGRNEVHRAVLQIKVPAARFDSLLGGLAPLGHVESVAATAQDVGEEYVDIEARLANLRREEGRLVELLANRTGKLSDVLTVERELARVRGEIDQIEGRRRFLQRSVALSTLELTLHEPEPVVAGTPGTNPIAVAFRDAWRYFVASVAFCITALGFLIPAGLFVGLIAVALRWGQRKAKALGMS